MSSVLAPLDSGLHSVNLFFDPDALSSLFNRPVRASHLRWKPGTSAVARLHDGDGVRWLAMYSADASVKLEKSSRRALTQNLELERFALDDGVLASGPITLDPRLYGVLRPFRRAALDSLSSGVRVLKYNPLRRVVFSIATGPTAGIAPGSTAGIAPGSITGTGRCLVGRASAARHAMTRNMLSKLAEGGVPLLVPLEPPLLPAGLPFGKHLEYLPWYGSGDLGTVPPAKAQPPARTAGGALALLHRQAPIHQAHTWRAPAGRLRSLVKENVELMPENRDRLERVQRQLECLLRRPGLAGVIHGDFSADQILVDGKDVRLIDFERCTYGAAASDLGSFAAVEALEVRQADRRSVLALPRTAALLDGYGSGPDTVNESEVLTWTAFYLLNRLREPFRACSPSWRQQMDARLAMIEEVLW
ncbi:phosphotransferase [uncultured Arthrobacter sp.]|uniref:phosphotransferase n=1 Tax=uncultured Arthrobacter sp. TaxID=114050 RepID=UPI0026321DEB|nr:phosphotransferase [uncultured Arthrobacter sp.]